MEVLRRNTDYALRAMVHLGQRYEQKLVSAREIALAEDVSYELACKILQRLHKAKLVESQMGPKGGFELSKKPGKISLLEIIAAVQGKVSLNRCLLGADRCDRRKHCPVYGKLVGLQRYIDSYLGGVMLDEVLHKQGAGIKRKNIKRSKK